LSTQAIDPSGSITQLPDEGQAKSAVHIWCSVLSPPLAAVVAMLAHQLLPDRQNSERVGAYRVLLEIFLVGSLMLAALHGLWRPLRKWTRHNAPLLASGFLVFCLWDLITLKFALMPLPYFPGPDVVLDALVEDRMLLLKSTYHSLWLLAAGYFMGAFLGLLSGVLMGWFRPVRYWGLSYVNLLGPIPATAFIPLAMLLFSSNFLAESALIALAVWFPVTVLTTAGIANVPVSYLDVARTLGAGRLYLIFRVAIPAAMPNIFLGLFMGLGASFLTLIAAETMGVQAGLGFYLLWQKGFAQFANMYAGLMIMALFFSGIMTLLFKVRNWVLAWQKGMIRL
jgi:NitT/TauT family transport system permease protein